MRSEKLEVRSAVGWVEAATRRGESPLGHPKGRDGGRAHRAGRGDRWASRCKASFEPPYDRLRRCRVRRSTNSMTNARCATTPAGSPVPHVAAWSTPRRDCRPPWSLSELRRPDRRGADRLAQWSLGVLLAAKGLGCGMVNQWGARVEMAPKVRAMTPITAETTLAGSVHRSTCRMRKSSLKPRIMPDSWPHRSARGLAVVEPIGTGR